MSKKTSDIFPLTHAIILLPGGATFQVNEKEEFYHWEILYKKLIMSDQEKFKQGEFYLKLVCNNPNEKCGIFKLIMGTRHLIYHIAGPNFNQQNKLVMFEIQLEIICKEDTNYKEYDHYEPYCDISSQLDTDITVQIDLLRQPGSYAHSKLDEFDEEYYNDLVWYDSIEAVLRAEKFNEVIHQYIDQKILKSIQSKLDKMIYEEEIKQVAYKWSGRFSK